MKLQGPTLALVLVSTGGCGAARMNVPEAAREGRQLAVHGPHRAGSRLRRTLQIGEYTFDEIERDEPETRGGWQRALGTFFSATPLAWDPQQSKTYRFDLMASDHTLHGECVEHAEEDAQQSSGINLDLQCVCTQANAERVRVQLTNGMGKVIVAGGDTYELRAVHESERGSTADDLQGYHLKSARGQGVIEAKRKGYAWLPASASEDEQFYLVCGYAAVYLYEPTERDDL